jgi:hypothetical protein
MTRNINKCHMYNILQHYNLMSELIQCVVYLACILKTKRSKHLSFNLLPFCLIVNP